MPLIDRMRRIGSPPWFYPAVFIVAFAIQCVPAAREVLIYDRGAIAAGGWWRIWTGHLVHFGWSHFVADGGLLLIIGWTLGREFPRASWLGLVLMPAFISAVIFQVDPDMQRYAGLSAVNLGLLLLLAALGWQGNWRDWFWPAIVVIYVAELAFEIHRGGQGGGFIQFDDPSVKVATSAHLAAAGYAAIAWAWCAWVRRRKKKSAGP